MSLKFIMWYSLQIMVQSTDHLSASVYGAVKPYVLYSRVPTLLLTSEIRER